MLNLDHERVGKVVQGESTPAGAKAWRSVFGYSVQEHYGVHRRSGTKGTEKGP